MPSIAIDRYWFFLFNFLDKYINSLLYEKQSFSIEQQGLEFYAIYTNTIIENKSVFTKKIKNKKSGKPFRYNKKDLNK